MILLLILMKNNRDTTLGKAAVVTVAPILKNTDLKKQFLN